MSRSRARDRSRPSGGPVLWTPAQRGAELITWLDADPAYVTLVTGAVAAWADRSLSGRNFAQASVPNRLGYSASEAAFGGRPAVLGTGMGWIDALASVTIPRPFTIYGVWRSGGTGDWRTLIDDSVGARVIVRVDPSGNLSYYAGSGNVLSLAPVTSASIVAAVFDGPSSSLYANSVTPVATGNPGTNGLVGLRVGGAPGSTYFLPPTGAISEIVLLTGADSADERAQMFRYLSGRYGLAVTGL